jgi:hypothetical protein
LASVGLVKQDLALQIALFHKIAVDQGQSAHAGARQQRRCGGSGSSAAHYGYVASGQALLTPLPDPGKKHLARVTLVNQNVPLACQRFHRALP